MGDDFDFQNISELIFANLRGAQDYWYWRDKEVLEVGAAEEVLALANISVTQLRSRGAGNDPPDCDGYLDGHRCGIEVSELLHQSSLKATIKGNPQYFAWDRDSLIKAIQARISRKDRLESVKGGPYGRYILILITNEMTLGRAEVAQFLEEAIFESAMITDVVLGLGYDPSIKACPVFTLKLSRSK